MSSSPLSPPLAPTFGGFGTRYNVTLHGRSVYRSENVSGHNVFRGYSEWEHNGHRGIGDGLDCFAPKKTPVYAMHDGTQTRWYNDATRLEVIYVEGGGWVTVYAHINAAREEIGHKFKRGDLVGWVRGDLNDPHLHLEVWREGAAVAAASPKVLAAKLQALVTPPAEPEPEPEPDVSKWAEGSVARAVEYGLMSRGADGLFHGTAAATREEVAAVAVRIVDLLRED